jgi:hypothetical protein
MSDGEVFRCSSMDEFVDEVRKALAADPNALIETEEGLEIPAADFLREWDSVKRREMN